MRQRLVLPEAKSPSGAHARELPQLLVEFSKQCGVMSGLLPFAQTRVDQTELVVHSGIGRKKLRGCFEMRKRARQIPLGEENFA